MSTSLVFDDISRTQYPTVREFTSQNYILKPLGAGSFATVYACIPKPTADSLLARYKSSDRSPQAFEQACAALRANLQAVKVAHNDDPETSSKFAAAALSDEVNHLRFAGSLGQEVRICPMLDWDHQRGAGQRCWYTMKPMTGGTMLELLVRMQRYASRPEEVMPYPAPAFTWNVIAQLFDALSQFQYGSEANMRYRAHKDVSPRNILFSGSGQGSYHNYPDAFLADFGNAEAIDFKHVESESARTALCEFQRKEVLKLLDDCRGLFADQEPKQLLQRMFEKAPRVNSAKLEQYPAALRNFVQQIVTRAIKERDEAGYVPLSEQMMEYFSQPLVSNEEFKSAFKILRKGSRFSSHCPTL